MGEKDFELQGSPFSGASMKFRHFILILMVASCPTCALNGDGKTGA